MILYNVTVSIDVAVHEEWLAWMRKTHIPEVMATGYFTQSRITKVLTGEEEGGKTYSIQYLCSSMEDYEEYQQNSAPALQQDHNAKYGAHTAAFRTLLNVIEEF